MSRRIVGTVFGVLGALTVAQLVEHARPVLEEPSLRGWLIIGFWLLKTGVVGAFCYFILARPDSRRRAREPLAFAACAAAIVGAMALQAPGRTGSTPLLLAGEAVSIAGCAWTLASVLTLGRCFGVLPEARGLVTHGPYRFVRHPVYLGEFVACVGLLIGAPTAWNLAAAGLALAGQVVRMRLEEAALRREFPAYDAYARHTPQIVPWPARRPSTTSTPAPGLGAS